MALVVCVHGIGQQFSGEGLQQELWLTPMNDGLRRAGAEPLSGTDLVCAFYGHLFRPPGRRMAPADPLLGVDDLDEFEEELLMAWWAEAARVEPSVIGPDDRTLAATPRTLQRAMTALSNSRFFAKLTTPMMIADLRQVRAYLHDSRRRAEVQACFAQAVTPDTRVVVAHSLGSVVAYEGLAAHPEWKVDTFVTLGSPLGIRNLIYDRLEPGGGTWPGSVRSWINIVDDGDVVAPVKDLRPRFGPDVVGYAITNGSHAHDVTRYLTTEEAGAAVARGRHGH